MSVHLQLLFMYRFIVGLLLGFSLMISLEATGNSQNPAPNLSDSIYAALQVAGKDTVILNELFVTIRNNRRQLGNDYKPLLSAYIEHTRQAEHLPGLMYALDRMGLQERFDENYDLALALHEESLQLALELADSAHLTYVYSNIGQVYRKQDFNALAIKNFHLALSMQEAINDVRGVYFTQNVLGATYYAQEDYDKALYFLNRSLASSLKENDIRTTSYNYGCLGEVYMARDMADSALYYFVEGRKMKEELDYDKGLAVSDHLIGQAYFAMGDYDRAGDAFRKALMRHRKYNTERYQSLCLGYLGKIALIEHKHQEAEVMLLEARNMAEKVNSLEHLVIIEEALFDLYRATIRHEEAFQALQNQFVYRDSIRNARNLRSIQTLEVEYQTRQKEHQIALLSHENLIKNQRIQYGGGILFLLLVSIVLLSVMYSLKQRNAVIMEAGLQHRLSRSQMNPHFVSNVMASISKYVMESNVESATRYLNKFSSLNRSVLEHSMVESISLAEEIHMLRSYLEFEQLRLGNAFSFAVEQQDDLDTEMIYIPPLFIQPFVENAIKHGVKDMEGKGEVKLQFSDWKTMVKVEIMDNGAGMVVSENKEANHHSRSMEIVKKRLQLLRKKYKKLPEMEIQSDPSGLKPGVHVIIYLPII